jgi:hypothetical protein
MNLQLTINNQRPPIQTVNLQVRISNQNKTNEFHLSLVGTVDNNQKRPAVPARNPPLLSRISSYNDIKNCPICKYKFPRTATEFEIDEHMDECISASNNLSTRSEQHACPYCEQQFPANDKNYIQHLTDCLNERAHNF